MAVPALKLDGAEALLGGLARARRRGGLGAGGAGAGGAAAAPSAARRSGATNTGSSPTRRA